MQSRMKALFTADVGPFFFCLAGLLVLFIFCLPETSRARIYIDIDAPSAYKLKIAIPEFKNLTTDGERADLTAKLADVAANDLDLSGYFEAIDRSAYLVEGGGLSLQDIRFRDWSVIGAELLLKAAYTCIGRNLEIEFRLFDVFLGRQILGKRVLGYTREHRKLVHRMSNEIIKALSGHEGMFLTRIAFVADSTGHKEIYTCDFDGHGVKQITRDKSIALLPRWSPDGTKLIYNSYKEGEGPALYLKDMKEGGTRKISARPGLNIGACWAPGGKGLALTLSSEGDPNVFRINLNGEIVKQLTRHWSIDVSPAFSPDGEKMAFVSSRSGSPQIYVMDLTNGTEERITFEGRYNTSPCWSSKNEIAFESMEGGSFDVCSIAPDGSRLRKLTRDNSDNEDPSWSPDGRYIVFSSNRRGSYHLYIMNSNGRNQRRITPMKGNQTAPSWGPGTQDF